MIRAVIYCRCSTEEECQRDALIRQAAEARECVRRLNWFLADEYIESKSGTSVRGREQYQRLFEDILGNHFDVVVIKSQDRLMRNTKDWYIFIDRLVSCRKKLYLYLEQRFYTADDSLITGIKAILAEEYSRELSRKINNAHKHRQQTGNALMLTSNTYGYRKLPDKSLGIIEEEAQVKRQMYELCAAGYGSRTIARILREKGVRKRNGNYFSDSDIRRMIRNPINKGTVVMNRRHFDFDTKQTVKNPDEDQYVYENRIPAIVSQELWKRANQEIDKRARKKAGEAHMGKSGKEKVDRIPNPRIWAKEQQGRDLGISPGKYILSGKLVCGLCGAPFYRTTRKRKHDKIYQWKCRTYLEQGRTKPGKEGGCDNIHLEEKALFSMLEGWGYGEEFSCGEGSLSSDNLLSRSAFSCGNKFMFTSELEEMLTKLLLKLLKESLQETRQKEQVHSQQYDQKLRRQQSLLLEKYLEGIIDESLYKEKQRDLQKKRKEQDNLEQQKNQRQPDKSNQHPQQSQNLPLTDNTENSGTAHCVPDSEKTTGRLTQIKQFLKTTHPISRAYAMCLLEHIEKITVFPTFLEITFRETSGKSPAPFEEATEACNAETSKPQAAVRLHMPDRFQWSPFSQEACGRPRNIPKDC